MIKKIKTATFQKHSKALLFLLVSLICFTVVVIAAAPVPCKDCGNVDRCDDGNGEDYGYKNCKVIYWEPGHILSRCEVSGWGGCGGA